MNGIVAGFDLCDDYSQVSCYISGELEPKDIEFSRGENIYSIPTVVCKKRGADEWLIGEDAFQAALTGAGIMVDKLLRLVRKNGTATIEGKKYTASQLLTIYLEKVMDIVKNKMGQTLVTMLVFTVQELDERMIEVLTKAAEANQVPEECIHIISHSESYHYYVLSQRKELWTNLAVLFDLTDEGLHYYEMEVTKGETPNIANTIHNDLEERFSLDILDNSSGKKMADSIMVSCARRLFNKKNISSVYLTGRGLASCEEWATEFLKFVCEKRRVFFCQNLFCKGAAYLAADYLREYTAYPYTCLCEGRISSTVSMEVRHNGATKRLLLAEEGTNWHEAKSVVDFILDEMDVVEIMISKAGENSYQKITIPLENFPNRQNKTTRVQMVLTFHSEHDMTIRLLDKGFGELFPATDVMIKQEIKML